MKKKLTISVTNKKSYFLKNLNKFKEIRIDKILFTNGKDENIILYYGTISKNGKSTNGISTSIFENQLIKFDGVNNLLSIEFFGAISGKPTNKINWSCKITITNLT